MRRVLLVLTFLFLASRCAPAQDRPFKTTDVQTVPAGDVRAEIGFDFLQDVGFPVSGLRGDETSVGVLNLRMGISKIAEIEVEGAIQNFLDVKSQGVSFVPNLKLTGVNTGMSSSSAAWWTGDFCRSSPRRPPGRGGWV